MDEDEAGGITTRQMDAVPLPVLKTPVTLQICRCRSRCGEKPSLDFSLFPSVRTPEYDRLAFPPCDGSWVSKPVSYNNIRIMEQQ
jgi:hypothetical protein